MADTPPVKDLTTEGKGKPAEFKVLHVLDDGSVHLDLGDGRVFAATVDEKVEGVKKGAHVTIRTTGLDKDEVPAEAVVTKVL